MVLPFAIGAIGLAVGAVAGAFSTHAFGEKDRQAAKHHRTVANELSEKYSALKQRYDELADKSQRQIDQYLRQKALDEVEKDGLRLVVRLQQSLISLMGEIDKEPAKASLTDFRNAVSMTNCILQELKEELIFVPSEYYIRNILRARELEEIK
ncbi:MAG: hypothetical protein HC835_09210 [Oscillatoriales cyanobacterium RM2_1_1]|nr:hypothetical protein [Oscillatoriales cyanobacterium SM2_3_0]NJO45785.1 hypothetical protein [Oscillatoriales cyanobacterium RM2_1_1]